MITELHDNSRTLSRNIFKNQFCREETDSIAFISLLAGKWRSRSQLQGPLRTSEEYQSFPPVSGGGSSLHI